MTTAMGQSTRLAARCAQILGIYPKHVFSNLGALPTFLREMAQFRRQNTLEAFRPSFRHLYPILNEKSQPAGSASGHYFYQDLWAARKIFERRPEMHLDIGSRIDGFVAHLLVFMPVTLVDLRPLKESIEGLTFINDDASNLRRFSDASVESISSLHAAEHFGLGRYGDKVDATACFRFMSSLERVLKPGGRLYFSVPVGRERVEFNAHRVFEIRTVLRAFPELRLVSFSLVGDDGHLYTDMHPDDMPPSEFACGLFEFTKED
jgi:SAM-dependent methyltransferase